MNRNLVTNVIRAGLLAFGVLGLAVMVGFFFLQDWATALIPWELSRLAGVFMASICAASSLPMIWIALSKEYAAVTGGAVDFSVTLAGFALFSFQVFAANPRQPVLVFGSICAAGFLVMLALIYFGLLHSFQNTRPLPNLVRFSFLAFVVILTLVGARLVLKHPNVFPWELTPQQSVLYGWIFLGAACYFLYGFLRPVWSNAHGQLIGFLAYDLVLILPFLALLFSDEPYLLPNLLIYITVLVYSGGLAIYYLFVNRDTRISFRPLPE